MTEDKILTKEEVLRDGVCFEDELDWGGEFYEQIVCENELGEEVPYTGLAYDLYSDGQLEFYGYIDNGYRHGLAVYFYSNGKIKSINNQDRGSAEGIQKEYFENGDIESVSYCIAGRRNSL
ncbi:MAG: toxin-antitoxin system YwqK family antitoxin [Streptococcus sp.]